MAAMIFKAPPHWGHTQLGPAQADRHRWMWCVTVVI